MSVESAVARALASARLSAVHLEMRDSYTPDDQDYADWRAGIRFNPAERWHWWFNLVVASVSRGVVIRRARIVSEPITDFIRFEHEVTADHNVAAGEAVRWLPRRRASDLALPGNDFWLFDDGHVIFNHFAGEGGWADPPEEACTDPATVKLCSAAFEAVWDRAVPHEDYRPV